MESLYHDADHFAALSNLFQDPLSQEVFWARLRYDANPSVDNALRLFELTGFLSQEEIVFQKTWKERFSRLHQENKKIFLYGCGVGRAIAELLLRENTNFWGFCDKNAERYASGILGKPVLPPSYVLDHSNDCYVVITTMDYYLEIYHYLVENGFPEEHILPYFSKRGVSFSQLIEQQYFDFPEFYPANTAFIDAGCFNCQTSILFSRWCGGSYSKIVAFEPDPRNYAHCTALVQSLPIKRMDVIQAGLSNTSGMGSFSANATSSSFFVDADNKTDIYGLGHMCGDIKKIRMIALDDISEEIKVGFIKMDIEGEEFRAVQGAQKTILRDKPLLAISVYHRCGDVLAITNYLHELVPEYHFWLRHYSPIGLETVLYAAHNREE